MPESRGQPCYEEKKAGVGTENYEERKEEEDRERRIKRRESGGEEKRLAQKRANVGKIGGGSQQLLAGMSGNAWDSILKARPRQSPVMPPSSTLSLL